MESDSVAISIIYNIDEIESILKPKGITKTSLYRAIALGKLKAIKIGKRYLVSELALNRFLEGKFDI
ncbi:helix-turn-helix domain-containing protein [Clostridium sp.]|uniref:helix-turn-helix domain-containing protein n=1 Tax=Clostridium sp. TaxID=1506 RepID=UPI003D6C7E20